MVIHSLSTTHIQNKTIFPFEHCYAPVDFHFYLRYDGSSQRISVQTDPYDCLYQTNSYRLLFSIFTASHMSPTLQSEYT